MHQSVKKDGPRIIKKYGSLRLYDTARSSYINFAEFGEIIANGFEVHVIDAKTNKDITQETIVRFLIENINIFDFCSDETLKMIIKAQHYSTEQKLLVMDFFSENFKFPS